MKNHFKWLRTLVWSAVAAAIIASVATDASGQLVFADESELLPKELAEGRRDASKEHAVSADTWREFSNTLKSVLKGNNDALKAAALRLVIQYSDDVDVDDSVFDIVGLYRDQDDERVRRMAVVAIGAIGHEWGLDFLKRSLAFEKSTPVKHTIAGVVMQHSLPPFGPTKLAVTR